MNLKNGAMSKTKVVGEKACENFAVCVKNEIKGVSISNGKKDDYKVTVKAIPPLIIPHRGNRGHKEVWMLHNTSLENDCDFSVSVVACVVPLDCKNVLVGSDLLIDSKPDGFHIHQNARKDLCVLL